MEALANKISMFLVSVDAAKEDDREIISFGLFHILTNALQISILIAMALYFNALPQITAYTLFFSILKRYAGGAHASRNWICITISTAMVFSAYIASIIIPVSYSAFISVICSAVALLLVLLKAPVIHPNNPKSAKAIKKLRKIAVSVALFQLAVILSGCFIKSELARTVFLCGALGNFSAAVTLILPMTPYNKEEVN